MAMNNRERIDRGFSLLSEGLIDPVDEVMTRVYGTKDWNVAWSQNDAVKHGSNPRKISKDDVQTQLRAITEYGREFNGVLSRSQQAYASELRETRNQWAHGNPFSSDDTIRALSTMEYLLNAVSAPDSAGDVRKLRDDLQRTVYEDHVRKINQRKALSVPSAQGMKPWREVIQPHEDVASGHYSASEFAANLYQVAVSKEACEPGNPYGDPVEFFNRTYLTEGLRDLLSRAIRRLLGDGNGSPVVNLQTNFGGGKTHSLLALYHLFGGTALHRLSGDLQNLISEVGIVDGDTWEHTTVHRVAIVGNFLNAGKADEKPDGTVVHTIWGELAWQLGGREGYGIVAENDRNGTPPGHLIHTLLQRYSPCLILIDEWVAYARQLVGRDDLPAGTFDNQFTFAQSLTEAVSATPHCMLVISIPASEEGGRGSDMEIGGENGRQALSRLQNIVRRKADQWRPSTKDESFEIVRKRLFEEPDAQAQDQIAITARQFVTMYRKNSSLYPSEALNPGYEKRIRASYPLHPELLDRLYEDWSSLENFQRTRGVLTLVSNIIHELWTSNDSSPLILPGNVPLEADTVSSSLTQYLRDSWKPVIEADISGAGSTAATIDGERTILGQRHLTQRVARTVFMGTAPFANGQNRGISEQSIRLGTTIPGDQEGNFGTALRLLGQKSTYFLNEHERYRYGLTPSIDKTAREYAEQLCEDRETVLNEVIRCLKSEESGRKRGLFRRVCIAPGNCESIPDVDEATLVIVHPRWSIGKGEGEQSDAMRWIRDAIDRRGAGQRVHRNMLVFLVADRSSIGTVEGTARTYLGWRRVLDSEQQLNLTSLQIQRSKESAKTHLISLKDGLRQTFRWCVYPEQNDVHAAYTLAQIKLADTGDATMAERVGARLEEEDLLNARYNPASLGDELHHLESAFHDGVLTVAELWEYMTKFPYMSRLVNQEVLDQTLEQATNMPLDSGERFALAAGRNDDGWLENLVLPGVTEQPENFHVTDSTLIVQWDAALAEYERQQTELNAARISQVDDETENWINRAESRPGVSSDAVRGTSSAARGGVESDARQEDVAAMKTRYYCTVDLDSETLNRQLNKINEDILDQLRLARAKITISLDIQAENRNGFDENTMRIVNDMAKALNLKESRFEER